MKSLEQRTVPSLVNHGKEWIVEFLDTPGDIPMMLVQRKAMCTLPYWLVLARWREHRRLYALRNFRLVSSQRLSSFLISRLAQCTLREFTPKMHRDGRIRHIFQFHPPHTAVEGAEVVAMSDSEVGVSWSVPVSNGGSEISKYLVQCEQWVPEWGEHTSTNREAVSRLFMESWPMGSKSILSQFRFNFFVEGPSNILLVWGVLFVLVYMYLLCNYLRR